MLSALMKLARHIQRSRALMRREALILLGLSFCLHVSFVASVCGLGLLAAPWFACELFAFLLVGMGASKAVRRHRGWFVAGALFLGLQLLILTGVTFAWIGLSTSAPLQGAAAAHDVVAIRPLLVFVSALVAALGVSIPLTFVPHHLLAGRMSALQALADGLRDARRIGFAKLYQMVLLTQLVQLTPYFVMAVLVTWIWGRQAIPFGVLVLFPLQAVLLPFSQGVIASVFTQLSKEPNQQSVPAARWSDVFALALPILLCLLSVASLLRPAPLPNEPRYDGVPVFSSQVDGPTYISRDGDLQVALKRGSVYLETSDGGGAGKSGRSVRSFNLEERADTYVAKLQTDKGPRALHFDRAGVRLDDGLSDRLAGHVPEWFFILLMVAMVLSTWAVYTRRSSAVLYLLIAYDIALAAIALG